MNEHPSVFGSWPPATVARLARIRVPMSADALVRQLHGRDIHCWGASWQIDIYSVVDGDPYRWMQIGLSGTERRTVTLKLARFADDVDVVGAIEEWLRESPWPHGGVLTVSASN
jgi:hypothetical protein